VWPRPPPPAAGRGRALVLLERARDRAVDAPRERGDFRSPPAVVARRLQAVELLDHLPRHDDARGERVDRSESLAEHPNGRAAVAHEHVRVRHDHDDRAGSAGVVVIAIERGARRRENVPVRRHARASVLRGRQTVDRRARAAELVKRHGDELRVDLHHVLAAIVVVADARVVVGRVLHVDVHAVVHRAARRSSPRARPRV
jgi:hypothetical protein